MPEARREVTGPRGLGRAEADVRAALRDIRPIAADRLDELERPLVPGTDYRPAALFLLGCEWAGVESEPVLPFAAAIHALDLACRPLARLMGLEDYPPRRRPEDARHDDGFRLLLADGLLIAAHGFLPALEPGVFRALSPLLVERLEALVPAVEASGGTVEAIVEAQRLLAGMAARGVALLPDADPGVEGALEKIVLRVDEALTAWRRAGDDEGRMAAAARLAPRTGQPGAAYGGEEGKPALGRYVSLVRERLDLTCGRGAG